MRERNCSLDIVRITGAYMVLFCHIGQYCGLQITSEMRKGVQLLFILSGFLIFQSLEKSDSIKGYFIKRIIRIVPIYWVTLCVNYLTQLLWFVFVEGKSFNEAFSGPCGIRYLRYFSLLHMCVPTDNFGYWNNAYAVWTMSSFAVFYVLAPVLFRWINTFWKSMILMILSLCLRPVTLKGVHKICLFFLPESEELRWFSYDTPLNTFYCFLIGIVIYFAVKENKQVIVGAFMGIMFICGQTQWYGYEAMLSLFILTAASHPIYIKNWNSVIKIMADSSYALYLIHPMLLKVANNFIKLEVLGGYKKFLLLVVIGVSGGILYWHFIEKPAEKVAKKILNGRSENGLRN